MPSSFKHTFLSLCLSLFFQFTVSAQTTIDTNEPVSGRTTVQTPENDWIIEVKEDAKIEFELTCDTACLRATLVRQSDNYSVRLKAIKGFHAGRPNAVTTLRPGTIAANTETKVNAGRYRLTVDGGQRGEVGKYVLTVVSPIYSKPRAAIANLGNVIAPVNLEPRPRDAEVIAMERRILQLEQAVRVLTMKVDRLERDPRDNQQ